MPLFKIYIKNGPSYSFRAADKDAAKAKTPTCYGPISRVCLISPEKQAAQIIRDAHSRAIWDADGQSPMTFREALLDYARNVDEDVQALLLKAFITR